MAEGEMNASRWLKEASEVISESPAALQLRYLQALQSISAENSSTIIFPLPMDVLPQSPHMSRRWAKENIHFVIGFTNISQSKIFLLHVLEKKQ